MKNIILQVLVSIIFILFTTQIFAENQQTFLKQKQNVETVDIFYYGPGADEDVMTAIIGKKPIKGRSAILQGYKLGIQGVNEIPDIKVKGSSQTARQIIKGAWGPDFLMHAAHKGKGLIKGIVWTINKEDLGMVKKLELVKFKWYSIVKSKVVFADGGTAQVLTIVVKNQPVQKDIDGLNYDLFLDKGHKFKELFLHRVATVRKQYLESISNGQESKDYDNLRTLAK